MKNNLNYVDKIMNEIDNDSFEGTKIAISDFMKKVDILGFALLKKEFNHFNLLEYSAKNNKWKAFLSCYIALSNINTNNPINDIKMVSSNVLKKCDNEIIKKYLNLIIEKCDWKNLSLVEAIVELPKMIKDQKLKFILDTLKENNFDFSIKNRIGKYYNTLLNEAIENPDWTNEEVELLLSYNNNIDKENINIDRIVKNPSKIKWLMEYGINIYEELSIPYYKSYFNVLVSNKNLNSETLEIILNSNININEVKVKEYGYTEEKDLFITHLLHGNFEVCLTLLSKGKDINNLINYKTSDILYNFYETREKNTIQIQKELLSVLIKNPKIFDNDFTFISFTNPLITLYNMKDLDGEDLVIKLLKNKVIDKELFESSVIKYCSEKYEIEHLNSYINMLEIFSDDEKNEILNNMILALDTTEKKEEMKNIVLINKSLLEQKRLENCFDKKGNKYKVKQRL